MATPSPQQVTQLLQAWGHGDQKVLEQLIPAVYAELHRLARRYMSQERSGHPLQSTALVNKAYLRLNHTQHISLDEKFELSEEKSADLLLLDEALKALATFTRLLRESGSPNHSLRLLRRNSVPTGQITCKLMQHNHSCKGPRSCSLTPRFIEGSSQQSSYRNRFNDFHLAPWS